MTTTTEPDSDITNTATNSGNPMSFLESLNCTIAGLVIVAVISLMIICYFLIT